MTSKEAIKGLKNIFSEHELDLPCQDSLEVRNIAIKALEKQIPKKPIADDDGWLCCPNCNETFPMFDSLHKRLNCCGCCGQRLDWSKANNKGGDNNA